jgi:hypothetical protein
MYSEESYREFEKLYETRPFDTNEGGMDKIGMYLLWRALNAINPSSVIESGIWKGNSTWAIDNSADAIKHILCIDPHAVKYWHPSKLNYVSEKAFYSEIDLLSNRLVNIDVANCVAFLDDHQDVLPRIRYCHKKGIKHIIMDDNYKTMNGSHISLYCLQNILENHSLGDIPIEEEINLVDTLPEDIISQSPSTKNSNLTYIRLK